MKIGFTVLLHILIHSLRFLSCEDPSLEEIVVNEAEKAASQFTEEPQKVICYFGGPQPKFPGGTQELFQFFESKLNYPTNLHQVEGTVYLQFIVNKNGTLSDFIIMKELHPDLDVEAMRVAKLMPNWTPGKQNGQTVRTKFTMPVKFQLN